MKATIPRMLLGIVALSLISLVLVVLLLKRTSPNQSSPLLLVQQQLTTLQEQIHRITESVSTSTQSQMTQFQDRMDHSLKETANAVQTTHKTVGDRIDRNTQIFSLLQDRLGKLEETNKNLQSVGEDIARLQEVLSVPKLRGNLGELFLEELLAQILPPSNYEMQYAFRNGEKVDAILRLAQGNLISIDSKFPLENFQRMLASNLSDQEREGFKKAFFSDFKKQVDQIAEKYIRPDEGTLDFALLYVPAENVYYEAILRADDLSDRKSINQYALSKRVIPVSPNSLYAYLQAIMLGLRGLKIESQAKEIFAYLSQLKNEFEKLKDDLSKVNKHFVNAKTMLESSEKRVSQIENKMISMENSAPEKIESEGPKISLVGSSKD